MTTRIDISVRQAAADTLARMAPDASFTLTEGGKHPKLCITRYGRTTCFPYSRSPRTGHHTSWIRQDIQRALSRLHP